MADITKLSDEELIALTGAAEKEATGVESLSDEELTSLTRETEIDEGLITPGGLPATIPGAQEAESAVFGAAKGVVPGAFKGIEALGKTIGDLKREGLAKTPEELGLLDRLGVLFEKKLKESEAFLEKEEELAPGAFKTAEIGAQVLSPIQKGIGRLGPAAASTIEGAVFGAEDGGVAGAIVGGAAGLTGGLIGKGATLAIKKAAPIIKKSAAVSAAKNLGVSPVAFKKLTKSLPGKTLVDKTEGLGEFMLKNNLVKSSAEETLEGASALTKQFGEGLEEIITTASEKASPINMERTALKRINKEIVDPLLNSKLKDKRELAATVISKLEDIKENPKLSLAEANAFRKDLDGIIEWDRILKTGRTNKDSVLIATRKILNEEIDKAIESGVSKVDPKLTGRLGPLKKEFQKAKIVEEMAATKIPRELLSPEIHSKDLLAAIATGGLAGPGVKGLGVGVLGLVGGRFARKAGRRIQAKAFSAAEKEILKPRFTKDKTLGIQRPFTVGTAQAFDAFGGPEQ